jgi:hypothetical protein
MIEKEEQELIDMFYFANEIHGRLFNFKMIMSNNSIEYSEHMNAITVLINDIQMHNLAMTRSIDSLRKICTGWSFNDK